jgi:hypothetical protein
MHPEIPRAIVCSGVQRFSRELKMNLWELEMNLETSCMIALSRGHGFFSNLCYSESNGV